MKKTKFYLLAFVCIISLFANTAFAGNTISILEHINIQKETAKVEITKVNNSLTIMLNTASPNGNTCMYEGICSIINDKIICGNKETNSNNENVVIITPIDNKTISLESSMENYYCGNNAYFTGKYIKK